MMSEMKSDSEDLFSERNLPRLDAEALAAPAPFLARVCAKSTSLLCCFAWVRCHPLKLGEIDGECGLATI